MDIKQLAEQQLARERAAEEKQQRWEAESQAREEQKRQLAEAFTKTGSDVRDPVRVELTSEQQALVQEFIAAVPPRCWETKFRKYIGPDGQIRIACPCGTESYDRSEERASMLLYKAYGHAYEAKQVDDMVATFPRYGAQRSVIWEYYDQDYGDQGATCLCAAIFQDGDVFGLSEYDLRNPQNRLVAWLAGLMRNA